MGWQTCEALYERKLRSWVEHKTITSEQSGKVLEYCENYGFWDALGYATRLKYRNKRAGKGKR